VVTTLVTSSNVWYRIASGDAEGRVVCWDVQSGQAVSGLDDPWQAATGKSNPRIGGVRALAWVMSDPCLLAVALSNMLIIWDPRGVNLHPFSQSIHLTHDFDS
jgi:WD40 repeat protein